MSIAAQLARRGDDVTLIGSGPARPGSVYRYIPVPAIGREKFERWPSLPLFRNETSWEEATFVAGLLRAYKPSEYDVTLTCAYPWTNWALRRPGAPPHVFVTQNGDWPAFSTRREYRLFGCDGLVCINPDYFDRNQSKYHSALIPNGVDAERFTPGAAEHDRFGLPRGGSIVLMVSAMIASKNIDEAIMAVSRVPNATLVVAGDGPERASLQRLAERHLPGRFRQVSVPPSEMPGLYRTANAFLHLSRDESFGNVFVEAMACGTPVVAYDLPRTRWILGKEGCFAAEQTSEGIAAKLHQAIESRGRFSDALVQRASMFDWSEIAGQYQDFLRDVVSVKQR
jgi:glycosyltransferase involved in cell wall biosynthesis